MNKLNIPKDYAPLARKRTKAREMSGVVTNLIIVAAIITAMFLGALLRADSENNLIKQAASSESGEYNIDGMTYIVRLK